MNTFAQWCSRQEEILNAVQLPFKTYNLRNDLSLITTSNADICYFEETLALTLIFAFKIFWKKMVASALCAFWSDLLLCEPQKTTVKTAVLLGAECMLPKLQGTERTREEEVELTGSRDCRIHTPSEIGFVLVQQYALMLQMQKLRHRKVRWFASHQLRPKVRTKTQSFLLTHQLSNSNVLRNYLEILSVWRFLPLSFWLCRTEVQLHL